MATHSGISLATKNAATKFNSESPFLVYFYLGALILAYFAKYFCTSFLYVTQTLWLADQRISPQLLSYLFAGGYFLSMAGKRAAGNWADKLGGKKVQILSVSVYIPICILWSFGGRICDLLGITFRFPVFCILWSFNGFFALGLSWVAIMVCASNWMPPHMEGRLLAIVGCAPELGDACARIFLGSIIKHGWGGITILGFGAAGDWSTTSLSAALASIFMVLPMVAFVPESPLGYDEEKTKEAKKVGSGTLDAHLMTLACLMCGSLYAIRTVFLLYSVTWLDQIYCSYYHPLLELEACRNDNETVGDVASCSLVFTLMGMFSILLSGYAKDAIPKVHRGWILLVNSLVLLLTTTAMLLGGKHLSFPMALALVGMTGFGISGPYKTVSGAFAVDIGGKTRKGDVSSWMGVASNACGSIIILINGCMVGWREMFKILVACSIGCIVCSSLIIDYDRKKAAEKDEATKLRQALLES